MAVDPPPLPVLRVQGVSSSYISRSYGVFGRKTEKPVLHEVSLEMARGEIFGLVGESGCGKTTFGRCILGLIGYSGLIAVDGVEGRGSSGWQPRRLRQEQARKVQAVFQDPSGALNPVKSVGWILEEPLRVHRIGTKAEREKKVSRMLEMAGMDSSYKKRRPAELSSGQKQRVSIAAALMLEPTLLIADEPVSALDVSVGAQILNIFKELNDTFGLSILFISHNLSLVYYLCDRIAVMRRGRIVEQGKAEEIYANPQDPYTRELFLSAAE
ncbi:MAG: ATP-binding cassette domain-containing protein [Spirochaetaceae bacterium]|jgi:ABC-type glutathione transport system ATPase component|nr:ATP-binding cassette domain-containing protein [Spirochaetaceae bacterium]